MELINEIIGPDSDQIKWWQMGIRGVLIFVLAVCMVRYGDQRIFGKSTALDSVLGIILGSILSRAITGNSPFWETTFISLLLVGLHWFMAFLSFRFKRLGEYIKGSETELIREGKMIEPNMRKCNITENDICEACRKSKIEHLEDVKDAFLERSGDISLITFENKS